MIPAIPIALTLLLILGGCAVTSEHVTGNFVPSRNYRPEDCLELSIEKDRVLKRLTTLKAELDRSAISNNAIVGVGLFAFWPAMLALSDIKPLTAEYSRYKGWSLGLDQVWSDLKCGGRVLSTEPPHPASKGAP